MEYQIVFVRFLPLQMKIHVVVMTLSEVHFIYSYPLNYSIAIIV